MDPVVLEAISQLSSLDISVKEIGLRKLIKTCQSGIKIHTKIFIIKNQPISHYILIN